MQFAPLTDPAPTTATHNGQARHTSRRHDNPQRSFVHTFASTTTPLRHRRHHRLLILVSLLGTHVTAEPLLILAPSDSPPQHSRQSPRQGAAQRDSPRHIAHHSSLNHGAKTEIRRTERLRDDYCGNATWHQKQDVRQQHHMLLLPHPIPRQSAPSHRTPQPTSSSLRHRHRRYCCWCAASQRGHAMPACG